MVAFSIGGFIFFTIMTPKLVEVVVYMYQCLQYSHFDNTYVSSHVIVCGHITAVTARNFLNDFLHLDRGDTETHVLFLHPGRPDVELRGVLRTHYTRVQYLLGSTLNKNDLIRAKIHMASALFILANKHTKEPREEDHATA